MQYKVSILLMDVHKALFNRRCFRYCFVCLRLWRFTNTTELHKYESKENYRFACDACHIKKQNNESSN